MVRNVRAAVAVCALFLACGLLVGLSVASAGSGDEVVVASGGFVCDGPVDVDVLRVGNPGGSAGLTVAAGCSGRIGRVEISGVRNDDGIKVQNSGSSGPLTIGGGFVQCSGPPSDGTHQDGVQVMGGHDILFERVVFDCWGGGGGNWFVNRAGGGFATPTNVVCDGCVFGPNYGPRAANVNTNTAVSSGVRDSLNCEPRSGDYRNNTGFYENVVESPVGDPRCSSLEAMLAWAEGGVTEPPPVTTEPTTTEPPPTTTEPPPATTEPEPACDGACVDGYESRISQLEDEVFDLRAELDAAGANEGVLLTRISVLENLLAEIHGLSSP